MNWLIKKMGSSLYFKRGYEWSLVKRKADLGWDEGY